MRGLECKAQTDGVGGIEPVRNRMAQGRPHGDLLDITTVLDKCEHMVAHLEFGCARSNRADDAGDFLAGTER